MLCDVVVDGQSYEVSLEPAFGGGFVIGCYALPGCWSQGDTEADALVNIADAIHEYLEALKDLGRR